MFLSHSSTAPLHICPALQQVLILQGLAPLTVTNSFNSPQQNVPNFMFNITLLFFYSSLIKGVYIL